MDLWESFDGHTTEQFLRSMEQLVAELPSGDAEAAFEMASALDSTGHSDRAVPLYRQALTHGLGGERRRRAMIQLASSLRNMGLATESVTLLRTERGVESNDLDDAVAAFLILALVDTGREREAVSVALTALSRHLTRHRRSLANYARLL